MWAAKNIRTHLKAQEQFFKYIFRHNTNKNTHNPNKFTQKCKQLSGITLATPVKCCRVAELPIAVGFSGLRKLAYFGVIKNSEITNKMPLVCGCNGISSSSVLLSFLQQIGK